MRVEGREEVQGCEEGCWLRIVGWELNDYKEQMFNFEKLDVWNEAIAFADLVYLISRHFPMTSDSD